MNVLILSHKPPFPIIDGGCFAMTQFLKNISSIETIEKIEYFSIHTYKHPFITEEFPEIKNVNFSSSFVDTKIYFIDALISFIKFKEPYKEDFQHMISSYENSNYQRIWQIQNHIF